MNPFETRKTRLSGPEAKIEQAIMARLKAMDWLVLQTHGNAYQMGLPDLYACHEKYGSRWIEVKHGDNYNFTAAQRIVFPALDSKKIGIWVLFDASDSEISKLWEPGNWFQYFYPKVTAR